MISVPAAIRTELSALASKPLFAYEIALADGSGTLRYSTEDFTWSANAYTGLAVSQNPVKETRDFKVPEVTVSFANATNVLRPYLVPTDKLTNSTLTVRLLFRDSGGALLSDSIVLFKGIVEAPDEVDEERFDLTAVGIIGGRGAVSPRRLLTVSCPWQFANAGAFDGAGHCNYAQTTTANGAGSSSTSLTLTGNADKFANGDEIIIGAAGNAKVAIASGGGTLNLTLAAARTWADLDPVRHAACNREFGNCEKRQRQHRYGGFLAVSNIARLRYREGAEDLPRDGDPERTNKVETLMRTPVRVPRRTGLADPTRPVPVLYGRRRVPGTVIEALTKRIDATRDRRATFLALSEGPIDSLVRYYVDNQIGTDKIGEAPYTAQQKSFGIYWRDGSPGADDDETQAEYEADPSTQQRAQNRDFQSGTGTAYSETAYALLVQSIQADVSNAPDFLAEVKGLEEQRYTSGGSPDGSPAWTENPLWHTVDLLKSDKHGAGLAASDFDFAVTRPEADICDEIITSTEANTLATNNAGSPSTTIEVGSTEGFVPGYRVDVNGTPNTVDRVVNDTTLKLGTATTWSIGHTVIQKPKRFTASLLLDGLADISAWIAKFLDACRGYVTYDAGKIQLRVERAHVAERLTNGGMETWNSATDLATWVETISAGNTVNRESTTIRSGTYSARLDRTAAGNLFIDNSFTGLEPDRWYRVVVYARVSSVQGNQLRLQLHNVTRSDWALGANGRFSSNVSDNWKLATGTDGGFTAYEITFLTEPGWATTDTYRLRLHHNGGNGTSIYYDDASLRGPYSGDFRESGYADAMGIVEGSFRWGFDRKARSVNQVVVDFVNESGFFGPDQIVKNDFDHQRTYPVRRESIDGSAIVDRDQAARIADWRYRKVQQDRTSPGAEFVVGPAGLPVQPGDVVLVSHSVPNWTVSEQRVIEKEVMGFEDGLGFCVRLRTEPYVESVYGDVGAIARRTAARPTPTLTLTLRRRSARAVLVSWALSGTASTVRRYSLHKGTSAGFTPDASNRVGTTRANRFVYAAEHDEILATLYFKAVAITDQEEIVSASVSATIIHDVSDDLDPTALQLGMPLNYVYGSDFNPEVQALGGTDGSGKWLSIGTAQYPGTRVGPTSDSDGGGSVTWANPGNARDNNTGTAATTTCAVGENAIHIYRFAAATKTGRPRSNGSRSGSGGGYSVAYTLDADAGSPVWTNFAAHLTSEGQVWKEGPTLSAVDMSKFGIRITATGPALSGSMSASGWEVDFEEQAAASAYGTVSGDVAEIKGDGSTTYGGVERRFPGKAPATTLGPIFSSSRLGRAEVKLRKRNSGDTLDSNPVLVELYDADLGTVWTALSVAPADITASWRAFHVVFDPVTSVSGRLFIRLRTLQSKPIECNQVLVAKGDQIFLWVPSVEELSAGYLGNFSEGEIDGFSEGPWTVGVYKISEVS